MALSHSYYPSSKKRHEENIEFITHVMTANNINGLNNKQENIALVKEFNTLCNTLLQKPLDQIKGTEVMRFITILLKSELLNSLVSSVINREEYAKIVTSTLEEILAKHKTTISKVIEREQMALDQSVYKNSKDKHQQNLLTLGKFKTDLNNVTL